MNILDLILSNDNKPALDELSRNFGLSEEQTRNAVEGLIPALSRGIEKNTGNEQGMDELLDALRTGKHSKYMEQPNTLSRPETREDGNGILGHLFGNKQVSRDVAARVSQQSGVSSAILKKMLPVVASLVMGAISKKVIGGSSASQVNRANSGGIIGMLLDSDRDGSIWDDVLGMAAKTLLR